MSAAQRSFRFFATVEARLDSLYDSVERYRDRLGFVYGSRAKGAAPGRQAVPGRRRSERREAWTLTMKDICRHTDLMSLRIGPRRADGSCVGRPVKTIMLSTGLSRPRVERVLRDFGGALFLTSHQRAEKRPDGRYRGLSAVRQLSPDMFYFLDLGPRLHAERAAAWKRHKREQAARAARLPPPINVFNVAGLMKPGGQLGPGPRPLPAEAEAYSRRQLAVQLEVWTENQGRPVPWSSAECHQEAARRLRGPP